MGIASTTVYGSAHPRVRVLIADDHEVMRMGIRNLIQFRSGWSVCAEASNGQEAVEKTLQFHPDVVVMDLTMPVMNGLEAASEIVRTQPEIPVILFSLHVSDDLYPDLQKEGIRGAVAKADAARDLAQAVETVLGGGTSFLRGEWLPNPRFELIGAAGAGRLWGGNQRLPCAPSRWGNSLLLLLPARRYPENPVDLKRNQPSKP